MLLFLGVVGVIALRLLWISIFAGAGPSTPAADGLLPARGDIVDRNGVPLARTIQSWSIGLHPKQLVNDPMDIAKKLAAVMPEHSVADYYAMLKSPKSFIYLRRRATPELVAEVNTIGEPAIALAREPERLYPQTTLAAHVLGWTDLDGRGVFGMEKVLNNRLLDPARPAGGALDRQPGAGGDGGGTGRRRAEVHGRRRRRPRARRAHGGGGRDDLAADLQSQ
jgi:cell division protein FtsI (penicillin-binding protein 3)